MISVKISPLIIRSVLVFLLAVILCFPVLQIKTDWFRKVTVREQLQVLDKPASSWKNFVNHDWQNYLEKRFLQELDGFRAFLIQAYNEVKHDIFRKRPNKDFVWSPGLGYYPVDTIHRLNYDFLHKDRLKLHYFKSSCRLRVLQRLLKNYGVTFIIVPAPPKARLYPEYIKPYLLASPDTVLSEAVSYGDVLEDAGVNVLNVEDIFRRRKASSRWPFFTTTSFHWSLWAGSQVTNDILRKAEELSGAEFFDIISSEVLYGKSRWTDTDIALILNILSSEKVLGQAPFPQIKPAQALSQNRRIFLIGDSFSDQIAYTLVHALPKMNWLPDWLTVLDPRSYTSYTLYRFRMDGEKTAADQLQKDELLKEVLDKDLLILEVSDAYVARDSNNLEDMEFGLTGLLIRQLQESDSKGDIDLRNIVSDGWDAVEGGAFGTLGNKADLILPAPDQGKTLTLRLDLENMVAHAQEKRFADVFVGDDKIRQIKVPLERGIVKIAVPDTFQAEDSLFMKASLAGVSGEPLDLVLHSARLIGKERQGVPGAGHDAGRERGGILEESFGFNLISNQAYENLAIEGLSGLESNDRESWRWAEGPKTQIKFYVDPGYLLEGREFVLKLSFKNGVPIPAQVLTIDLNGRKIRVFKSEEIGIHMSIEAEIPLALKDGVNILEIAYRDWNHGSKTYGSHDPRKLAVVFSRFALEKAKETGSSQEEVRENAF